MDNGERIEEKLDKLVVLTTEIHTKMDFVVGKDGTGGILAKHGDDIDKLKAFRWKALGGIGVGAALLKGASWLLPLVTHAKR